MYLVIDIIMIVLGGYGLIKYKLPKLHSNSEMVSDFRFFLGFLMLFIMGIVFLIIELKKLFS